jgi:glycosyltransferase involved in cell wall biosynthesis
MKIAQLAPLAEAVPPRLYGGTERVVSYLTEELVAQGHDVTLFAAGDSQTSAELVPITPRALRLDGTIRDSLAPHIRMVELVSRRAKEFDIIHVHFDHLHLPLFAHRELPFVTTLHGRLDLPELRPLFAMFPTAPFVSISDSQRQPLPFVNWLATVHHGLPADLMRPRSGPGGGYLAFLGRVSPEKGPERAIRIAARAGIPLKIAAKVDKADLDYWEAVVRPLVRAHAGLVEFVGEISESEKEAFLGGAEALLFPIDWPEPFGLVMIEAMACGTPTIAFRRGSVPEVIDDGVSGFIVTDESDAAAAVARLGQLDRQNVRAAFDRRFTATRMAEEYVALYEDLLLEEVRPVLSLAS